MFATRPITVCRTCRTFWDLDGPSTCSDPDHRGAHVARQMHVHRDDVVLPDGTTVTAATFDERDPYARAVAPDFGLYFDERWQPPWPHDRLDWPDFGLPIDTASMVARLTEVLTRAREGQRVEIGCWGAHGRTGTALAVLAVLAGLPKEEAVAWVRSTYCEKAVETADQADLVAAIDTGSS